MKIFFSIAWMLSFWTLNAQEHPAANHIDSLGKKQGNWIIYGNSKPNSCYKPTQMVAEGVYTNDRKTGLWKEYDCSGNLKNKVMYLNGKPEGPAVIYHENGKKSEEGTWKNNRWIGHYIQYNEKGDTLLQCDFRPDSKLQSPVKSCTFDNIAPKDTITGFHTFYNACRQISKEGRFVNGKLYEGKAYFYNENNVLTRIAVYKDGKYTSDLPYTEK